MSYKKRGRTQKQEDRLRFANEVRWVWVSNRGGGIKSRSQPFNLRSGRRRVAREESCERERRAACSTNNKMRDKGFSRWLQDTSKRKLADFSICYAPPPFLFPRVYPRLTR